MKKHLIYVFISIMFLTVSWKVANDILEQIGLQEKTAQNYILQNVVGDFTNKPVDSEQEDNGGAAPNLDQQLKSFKLPRLSMLPDIVAGDKVAITNGVCAYIKEYVESTDFVTAYAEKRAAAKPTTEPYRMDASAIASLKASLKEAEANLVKMKSAKMAAVHLQKMEEGIASLKKTIAEQNDPTPNNSKWNKLYPANPADAVKARLQEYLTLAGSVDFSATTTASGRRKKFDNAAFEKKSLKWKAIYRAGKEVNSVATAFCKDWLNEGVKIGQHAMSMPANEKIANPTTKENEVPKKETQPAKKGLLNKLKSITKIPQP
ncbi:hypothetical protein [Pedobacter aquatilis]|uniref:hypothetical protein n=1 Tax=Pedobacter aquatilis TaxID=351343 RepID=UPI00292D0F73|nr:hypothetical protein [Pedobacter aquatilis]